MFALHVALYLAIGLLFTLVALRRGGDVYLSSHLIVAWPLYLLFVLLNPLGEMFGRALTRYAEKYSRQ